DGNFEIYTMAADGSDVRQITFTDPPTTHIGPKYSPDGSQLLYAFKRAADAEKPIQDLWIMNTDGSSPKQLTFGYNNAESRAWSPDGRRIAFNSIAEGVGQIFVMDADGTGIQQLTQDPATTPTFAPGGIFPELRGSVTPAWSPDGRSIAYASNREGNYEVYTMNPDGTNVLRLTNSPAEELSVGWSPDPQGDS
ncbi:MAG: DPP IV N-terminal domain-containing protein, partial [Candidatus Nanopelagicales bacterium]